MCGRFVNTNKLNVIKKIFEIKNFSDDFKEIRSFNIAPSHYANVIINTQN